MPRKALVVEDFGDLRMLLGYAPSVYTKTKSNSGNETVIQEGGDPNDTERWE